MNAEIDAPVRVNASFLESGVGVDARAVRIDHHRRGVHGNEGMAPAK
jgi:hypothetical protein